MIVDDNAEILEYLADALNDTGNQSETAQGCVQADHGEILATKKWEHIPACLYQSNWNRYSLYWRRLNPNTQRRKFSSLAYDQIHLRGNNGILTLSNAIILILFLSFPVIIFTRWTTIN
ncbi:MAG: hypothetical protein WCI88_16590 [Chloroflexota bacterium]